MVENQFSLEPEYKWEVQYLMAQSPQLLPHKDYVCLMVDEITFDSNRTEENLFIGPIRDIGNIGIKGKVGSALAKGIGTVIFVIMDSNNEKETITLENVI